ncbi:YdeI/OmpD-associated family protein [Allosphingosinicella flava]|uniref:YdeI/OmpD-associated family protein n=1 Tax=Allosphingosinicella flava TaxID=2771430 RepID=A0A7T2GJ86_9SPHN|nr:YdeI/OmpD-associated family protein [Sphingosinicella flava]QPQ54875.1 YdeI/OmpD-associated family protein [Sphingosinicella flava]
MPMDDRVDAYIARQADFARPILTHIRAVMHRAAPDIAEDIKWGAPAFLHNGRQIAMMAGFKAHAALNFLHGAALTGAAAGSSGAMGQFGKLTAVADLPEEAELAALIRAAMALSETGVKRPKKEPKPMPEMPGDFREALDADPRARAVFEAFSPSARREYLEWIVEAKRAETRGSRIAQAMIWIAEGKKRNWRYEKGCGA